MMFRPTHSVCLLKIVLFSNGRELGVSTENGTGVKVHGNEVIERISNKTISNGELKILWTKEDREYMGPTGTPK